MSTVYERDYDVSPIGVVVLRLSGNRGRLEKANGKTPWQLRITIRPYIFQDKQKLHCLLAALRCYSIKIDPALRLVKRRYRAGVLQLTFIIKRCCSQLDGCYRPTMVRTDSIARRAQQLLSCHQ